MEENNKLPPKTWNEFVVVVASFFSAISQYCVNVRFVENEKAGVCEIKACQGYYYAFYWTSFVELILDATVYRVF